MKQPLLDCRSLPYFLKEKNLSCQELEERCGFEKGTFTDIYSGRKLKLPQEIVEKTAKVLDVDVKNLGLLPCHNLRYYCDQRGLSCSGLEARCNLGSNTLIDSYNGRNQNMTYEKIKAAADALCVDIQDLGAPAEECVDIQKITRQLQASLASLPTTMLLKKKLETITACLSQTDDSLEPYISYIINDSNHLGRSCACYVLSSSGQDAASAQTSPQTDSSCAVTAVDWYRKKKHITKKELARKVQMSRPTLDKYLNGEKKPEPELLEKFAHILEVDLSLLAQDYAMTRIDRNQIEEKLFETIKPCRPQILKASHPLLLTYLGRLDLNTERLLGYLLLSSQAKKEETMDLLQDMMKCPLFYRQYYRPGIHIGYCRDEDDGDYYDVMVLFDKDRLFQNLSFLHLLKALLSNKEMLRMILSDEGFLDNLLSALEEILTELDENLPEVYKNPSYKELLKDILSNQRILEEILANHMSTYKALSEEVLLKGTVYPLIQLPSPQRYFSKPGSSGLPDVYMDFPYEIQSQLSPDDDDFENDFLDQVLDAFINDVAVPGSDSALTEILLDYVDECYENPDITAYPTHDLAQYIHRQQQEQKYRQLAAKIHETAGDIPQFIDAIAQAFSRMKEDPEYERRILMEYGLETGAPD